MFLPKMVYIIIIIEQYQRDFHVTIVRCARALSDVLQLEIQQEKDIQLVEGNESGQQPD